MVGMCPVQKIPMSMLNGPRIITSRLEIRSVSFLFTNLFAFHMDRTDQFFCCSFSLSAKSRFSDSSN